MFLITYTVSKGITSHTHLPDDFKTKSVNCNKSWNNFPTEKKFVASLSRLIGRDILQFSWSLILISPIPDLWWWYPLSLISGRDILYSWSLVVIPSTPDLWSWNFLFLISGSDILYSWSNPVLWSCPSQDILAGAGRPQTGAGAGYLQSVSSPRRSPTHRQTVTFITVYNIFNFFNFFNIFIIFTTEISPAPDTHFHNGRIELSILLEQSVWRKMWQPS